MDDRVVQIVLHFVLKQANSSLSKPDANFLFLPDDLGGEVNLI